MDYLTSVQKLSAGLRDYHRIIISLVSVNTCVVLASCCIIRELKLHARYWGNLANFTVDRQIKDFRWTATSVGAVVATPETPVRICQMLILAGVDVSAFADHDWAYHLRIQIS